MPLFWATPATCLIVCGNHFIRFLPGLKNVEGSALGSQRA